MNYADTKNEIISTLNLVSGIGVVYGSMKQAVDIKTLEDTFVTNGKYNVCYLQRLSAFEDDEIGIGSRDETDLAIIKQVVETWNITLFYAYKDSISTPSEFTFQALIDSIREKFRWLNDLNANAYKSYSVNFLATNIYETQSNVVLCHRADGKLIVKYRLIGESAEDTGTVIMPNILLYRRGTASITSSGTEIEFPTVDTTDYDVFVLTCVDANGDAVGVDISSKLDGKFTATSSADATLKWSIICLREASGISGMIIKRGTNAIEPAGTTVTFDDVGSTDYDVLIEYCRNALGESVGVVTSDQATNSFKATPTESATLKWIILKT